AELLPQVDLVHRRLAPQLGPPGIGVTDPLGLGPVEGLERILALKYVGHWCPLCSRDSCARPPGTAIARMRGWTSVMGPPPATVPSGRTFGPSRMPSAGSRR